MKLEIFISSAFVFQVFITYTFGKDFVIYRNRSWLNRNWDSRDYFKIPTSMCHQSSVVNRCDPFGATIDGGQTCSCSCDPERATFVFHAGQWTCLDNTLVRELEGDCANTHYFLSELDSLPTLDFELAALNIGDTTPTNIPYGSDIRRCEVYPNTSWYLGCNGMQLGSSQYSDMMKELFTFTVGNASSTGQYFDLNIKRGVQNTQLLQGGVICLGIQCIESSGHLYDGCMMFKLIGRLTCPAQVEVSSTVMPLKPTQTGTPTSKTTILPNSIVTGTTQHTRTRSIAFSTQATTVFPSIVRVRLSPDSGRDTNNNSSSLGLITGITVSILLIVIIVGFIFYGRRYSNKVSDASNCCTEDREKQGTVMMRTRTNSLIQQDNEKMYKALNIRANEPKLYALNYCVPQSAATRDNHDIDHLYDTIDDPEGYNSEDSQESFYSVQEECILNGETELKHPAAAYNILKEERSAKEGPEKPEEPVNYGSESMYNVQEEPYLVHGQSSGDCGSISSETQVTEEESDSNASEPVFNVLLPYLENTQSYADYGDLSSGGQATANGHDSPDSSGREPTVSNVLEKLYLGDAKSNGDYGVSSSERNVTVKGPEVRHGNDIEAVHNDLEGTYLENAQSPVDYGAISLVTQVTLEGPEMTYINASEPVYHILEGPYLESAESSDNNEAISSETQITVEEPERPGSKCIEPMYYVLEEPYLENAESGGNYGSISSETQGTVEELEGSYRNDTEPMYNISEEPYLNNAKSPWDYGAISPERQCAVDSEPEGPGSNCTEPVQNVLEELYLENAESRLERQITVEGPQGSDSNASESAYNVLEEPSLETAESPTNYGAISQEPQVAGDGPVQNVLEKPYLENGESSDICGAISSGGQSTAEGPVTFVNHGAELAYNVLENPYLEEAESPGNYSAISSREQATVEQPSYNGTESVLDESKEEESSGNVDVIFLERPICNKNVFRKIL